MGNPLRVILKRAVKAKLRSLIGYSLDKLDREQLEVLKDLKECVEELYQERLSEIEENKTTKG